MGGAGVGGERRRGAEPAHIPDPSQDFPGGEISEAAQLGQGAATRAWLMSVLTVATRRSRSGISAINSAVNRRRVRGPAARGRTVGSS
jgi:hypothetical protein